VKISIVIPAYNEAAILEKNVMQLFDFLKRNLHDYSWQIIVSDNKSTDNTSNIVNALANNHHEINYHYVGQKGKGMAINSAWQKYRSDIYCFMDADLATDIKDLLVLLDAVINEKYDIAVGSRYLLQSQVDRSILRKFISYCYHLLTKVLIGTKIKDLPCGFKAINNNVLINVVPKVQNTQWFFDSELLLIAESLGYKIKEVPVKWQEPKGRKSRVNPIAIGWRYFVLILNIRKRIKKSETLSTT
jgi:glycosyltransferase involved in cell wall biosynthesis